jgi:hypothetical protein
MMAPLGAQEQLQMLNELEAELQDGKDLKRTRKRLFYQSHNLQKNKPTK